MKIRPKFLGAAALTGLLLFLAASVFFFPSPGLNQIESFETHQAREQAERARLNRDDRQADFLAGWFQITLAATTLLVLGAGTVATVQFLVIQPTHRRKLEQARALEELSRLYPDHRGNYPAKTTPYGWLLQPAPGNVIQPVAQSLHYAPHLQLKEPAPAATLAALPENLTAPEAELPAGPVDLLSLLHNWKPTADNILLALGPGGKPITVAARDLCHVALAGVTGGGKCLAYGEYVFIADGPDFARGPQG